MASGKTVGAGWISPIRQVSEDVADSIDHFLSLDKNARMRMRNAAADLARQF